MRVDAFELAAGVDRAAVDACARARRPRRRRDVRHRVPRSRSTATPRGSPASSAGAGARASRSTSRRASTAPPARSRRRGARPTRRSPSPRASRAWCSSPGATLRRRRRGRRHRDRRIDDDLVGAVSLDRDDVRELAAAASDRRAQVARRGDGRRRLGRHDRRADAREPRRDARRRGDRRGAACPGDDAARACGRRRGDHAALPAPTTARWRATRSTRCSTTSTGSACSRSGPASAADAETAARGARPASRTRDVPLVLDADGLNALDGRSTASPTAPTRGALDGVTPHDGEYERLAGTPVGADRIAAARALADGPTPSCS